jgi:hypothetical protein
MVDVKKKDKEVTEAKTNENNSELKKENSTSSIIKFEKNGSTGSMPELSKFFIETNKKIADSLVNSSYPSLRNSVRKTTYDALVNKEEVESKFILNLVNVLHQIKDLAIEIEETVHKELFKQDDKGSKYLTRIKAIVSNLQDKKNPDFRMAVLTRNLSSSEITFMDVKKMASNELQNKRQLAEKDSFNSMRSDWHEVHAPVGVGMHTCEKCKGQRTTSKEIQLRGADEPMTL